MFGDFQVLFNEVSGDAGDGGGGDGGAPQPQPQPDAQPQAQPNTPQPGSKDAPVTRAEFDALMSKLDNLATPAPKTAPDPKPAPSPQMPDWAKSLTEQVSALTEQNKLSALSGRRQQLVESALADVPEANRPMAQAVLDGMLARSGVDLSGDVDLKQLAEQFSGQLRTQFGDRIYTVPGSQHKAVPKAANGGFDWSGINSLGEVPPGMIKHIPDDIYRRLRNGSTSTGILPDGGFLPQSRFKN